MTFTTSLDIEVPFNLGAGNAVKTIRGWYRNAAGRVSEPATSTIQLASSSMEDLLDLQVTPDGKELWAFSGSNRRGIGVVDLTTGDYRIIATVPIPGHSGALPPTFSPDGRYAYVSNSLPAIYEDEQHRSHGDLAQILVLDAQTKKLITTLTPPGGLRARHRCAQPERRGPFTCAASITRPPRQQFVCGIPPPVDG